MAEPVHGGATQRVRQRAGLEVLALLEEELSASDLTTLLLSVAAKRAGAVTAGRLLSLSAGDRFTRAAAGDARALAALEHRLWQLLPERFEAIELSPLAPLGISSALAGVAQNRVVSTMRGSEVVSDATNVLALEAARRRRERSTDSVVHLAASHRVLRAQHFGDPAASAHFRLLNLVSSTRDRGSGSAQAELLLEQLRAWAAILGGVLPASTRWHVDFTVFRPGVVGERLHDIVIPTLTEEGVLCCELRERTGDDYYTDLAFKITMDAMGQEVELGDGRADRVDGCADERREGALPHLLHRHGTSRRPGLAMI